VDAGAPDLENFMRDRSQAVDAELAFRIHALDRACGPRRHDAIRTYDLAEALVDDDQVIANGVEVIDVAAVVPVQISAHLFTKHLVRSRWAAMTSGALVASRTLSGDSLGASTLDGTEILDC
jgi:hypothetical protein